MSRVPIKCRQYWYIFEATVIIYSCKYWRFLTLFSCSACTKQFKMNCKALWRISVWRRLPNFRSSWHSRFVSPLHLLWWDFNQTFKSEQHKEHLKAQHQVFKIQQVSSSLLSQEKWMWLKSLQLLLKKNQSKIKNQTAINHLVKEVSLTKHMSSFYSLLFFWGWSVH